MREDNIGIERYINIFRNKFKVIFLIIMLFVLISTLINFCLIKPKYEIKSKIFIGKEDEQNNGNYDNNDVEMYRRLIGTYSEIMKSEDLIINAIESKNLNLNSEEVYKKLKVTPRDETQIIEISYRDIDKERGLTLINSIINDFTEKSKELIPNGNVQVIEKAKLPTKPVSPNKFLNIFIAFILGIVFSIGLVLVLDFFDNTIKTREDIENDIGLILIGDIPEIRGNDIKNLKEELKEQC